jgi:hypothetical protein
LLASRNGSTIGANQGASNYQTGPYSMSGGAGSAAARNPNSAALNGNSTAAGNGGIGLYSGSLAGNSPASNYRTTSPASYNNDGAQGYGTGASLGRAPNAGSGSPTAPGSYGGYGPGAHGGNTGPSAYADTSGQYGNPGPVARHSGTPADRYGSPSSNYGSGSAAGNPGAPRGAAPTENYGPIEADGAGAAPPANPSRSAYPSTGDGYRSPDSRWQSSSRASSQSAPSDAGPRSVEGYAAANAEQLEFQNRAPYRPGSTGRARAIESQWTENSKEDIRSATYQRQPNPSEGTAETGANEPAEGPNAGSRWQR